MKEFYRIISYNILEGWGDETLGGRALLPGAERRPMPGWAVDSLL